MGLDPPADREKPGELVFAKVPVPIFSQPRRARCARLFDHRVVCRSLAACGTNSRGERSARIPETEWQKDQMARTRVSCLVRRHVV